MRRKATRNVPWWALGSFYSLVEYKHLTWKQVRFVKDKFKTLYEFMMYFWFNYDFSFVKTAWKMNIDEVEHRMWMYVSSFGNINNENSSTQIKSPRPCLSTAQREVAVSSWGLPFPSFLHSWQSVRKPVANHYTKV